MLLFSYLVLIVVLSLLSSHSAICFRPRTPALPSATNPPNFKLGIATKSGFYKSEMKVTESDEVCPTAIASTNTPDIKAKPSSKTITKLKPKPKPKHDGDDSWTAERIGIVLSNAFLALLIFTALCYDLVDVFKADLSTGTAHELDTHPLYTENASIIHWGYVPCQNWLRIVLNVSSNTSGLEVSNDIEEYEWFESEAAVEHLLEL